jgi:hypothetical protein
MCLDRIDSEEMCTCRIAVLRAYTGLVDGGRAELAARDAALRVFRWHHPTVDPRDGARIVAAWLDPGRLH